FIGNAGADVFNVTGNHVGNLSGGDGADTFNFLAGTVTGMVSGGLGNDSFVLGGGAVTGTVAGDGGNDTLSGGSNYVVTGVNSGTAAGIANWTTIENLVGTAVADTFVLAGGSIKTIDGLGGNDLLDVSGAAPDVTVTLTGTGSVDGFAGHSASAGVGSFDNINAIEAGGGDDTLVADIDAGGAFVVKPGSDTYTSGGNQLVFNGFENLTGGDGDDTFTLNESLPGVASGGGGD